MGLVKASCSCSLAKLMGEHYDKRLHHQHENGCYYLNYTIFWYSQVMTLKYTNGCGYVRKWLPEAKCWALDSNSSRSCCIHWSCSTVLHSLGIFIVPGEKSADLDMNELLLNQMAVWWGLPAKLSCIKGVKMDVFGSLSLLMLFSSTLAGTCRIHPGWFHKCVSTLSVHSHLLYIQ